MNLFKSIRKRAIRTTMIGCFVVIIIVGFIMAFFRYETLQSNIIKEQDEYLETNKDLIATRVKNSIEDLMYYESTTEETLKNEIQGRVEEASLLAEGLTQTIKNQQILQETFLEALRKIRFLDGAGYFYVLDTEGYVLLNADKPEFEGTNQSEMQDSDGQLIVQDIIEMAQAKGSGFYEYKWTKPGTVGDTHKKIAYFKYSKSLNMIIATGVYLEDMEQKIQKAVYDRFQASTLIEDDYLFIVGFNGIAKVFKDVDYLERDIYELSDEHGNALHGLFMAAIANPGNGGYVEYDYFTADRVTRDLKISYVEAFPKWKVYIGSGFYMKDFQLMADERRVDAENQLKFEILLLLVITSISGIFVYLFVKQSIKQVELLFDEEEMIYETLATLSDEAIFIFNDSGLVYECNRKAKALLGIDEDVLEFNMNDYIQLDKKVLENKIESILHTTKDIPVEIYLKPLMIRTDQYYALYLTDISERKAYEYELKQLATTDSLTGLYNRRYFMELFDRQLYLAHERGSYFTIALIDLDYFKEINDEFGHASGDLVLEAFGQYIKGLFRKSDTIARIGGDEFVALMPETHLNEGRVILHRGLLNLSSLTVIEGKVLTFSAGMIEVKEGSASMDIQEYLTQADEFLYKAKQNGRNRIETPLEGYGL